MDIRRITPDFYVSPQISVEDIPGIVQAGIKRVICNRPDEEVPPAFQQDAIEASARAAGLEFVVCALTHQSMVPAVIDENRAFIDTAPGPALAYCASGTRSTIAWAIGMANDLDHDEIIEAAAQAGYDIRGLKPTLQAIAHNAASG